MRELDSEGLVVTGLGTVSALGYGKEEAIAGFLADAPKPSMIEDPALYHHRHGARSFFQVDPDRVKNFLPAARMRRLSSLSRISVTAARMALGDAGLEEALPLGRDAAVVMSTAFGASAVTEEILRAIFNQGPAAASPFLFPESVASAPASQIAIDCGARGANLTLTQRNAGDLLALHRAATLLRAGRASYVLVGAVHQVDPLLHSVLDRFRALSRGNPEIGRPFDRDRDGFVLGEGATVLVLERARTARDRGHRVLAELLASSGAFDASAPPADWGDGVQTLSEALSFLLEKAQLQPADLARLVVGACGAKRGDALEAEVLFRVFGEELPAIIAPKAWCGQLSGALLAGAVLAASGEGFASCPGFRTPDPTLRVQPTKISGLAPGESLLISSLAAGGAAGWAVLSRPGKEAS